MIHKIPFGPDYVKANDLRHFAIDELPLPAGFEIKERNVVYIPGGEHGGNHKHPRTEAFVGFGEDLWIIWLDEAGKRHEDKMMEGQRLFLFVVEPFTPHVVSNRSDDFGLLVELADGPLLDVERMNLL